MSKVKRYVAGATLFAGAMVGAACSSNTQQVQDKIAESIKKETGVANAKVTCPSDVKASKGEKFTCDATGDFSKFLQTQGVTANLSRIRFNVEFVDDKNFKADVDTVTLQQDLASANSGAGSSSADTGSSSTDTGSSSQDNPALSTDSTSS